MHDFQKSFLSFVISARIFRKVIITMTKTYILDMCVFHAIDNYDRLFLIDLELSVFKNDAIRFESM